ncbi:protein involved in gliding motility GldH [Tenacibaculum adriaticum]|uniref:Protein involved in gliding motility GldH n=1 Tax=Tenacibaculum adriaticum TaxID=413713 RepID=A0A5S5DYS3_9FLAO|nr:gliding motility lipoprotein GldH [Tenacibaculum adriaticum]TYP99729.1 protein involved in gliding motility GldH [Tenacibaculum adriaticum]
MLQTIKNNNYLSVLILFLVLVSCDSSRVFDKYSSISNGLWNKEDMVSFTFSVNDTIAKRNLFINIRNNNKYPFSNLFLITQMNFPDGQKIIDTLEYDMADKSGEFLGEGFSEIKENKLFYKENILFPIVGDYSVTISHAMRKNSEVNGIKNLEGITEVGFRIEKIE